MTGGSRPGAIMPVMAAPRPPILRRASPVRRRLLRLYVRLLGRFGRQGWWPARTPFEVVVGAILTQNAAWTQAAQAIARLRAAGVLTPAAMERLPASRLASLLRPSGTYRVKAARLRAFLDHLDRHHHGSLRRLLRPKGRVLFLEHVPPRGEAGIVRGLARPFWRAVSSGCELEADVPAADRPRLEPGASQPAPPEAPQ